jgi:hypothetical protein
MLVGKIAELDLHKQFMMAIATNNEPRVAQLIRAGLNNGESIGAMLERFYRACVDVHREGPKYNPKGFTPDDYMVGLCVLRLGGARLADILHRALGLPGLTTLRKHSIIRPLLGCLRLQKSKRISMRTPQARKYLLVHPKLLIAC